MGRRQCYAMDDPELEALLDELPEELQTILRLQLPSAIETRRSAASQATIKAFRDWYNLLAGICVILFITYAIVVSVYNPHDLNWIGTFVTW